MNKSDIFPHILGQQISDNLDKCPWVPVGAPEVAPRGKPLMDALTITRGAILGYIEN